MSPSRQLKTPSAPPSSDASFKLALLLARGLVPCSVAVAAAVAVAVLLLCAMSGEGWGVSGFAAVCVGVMVLLPLFGLSPDEESTSGAAIGRAEAPDLWELVERTCAAAGSRVPGEVFAHHHCSMMTLEYQQRAFLFGMPMTSMLSLGQFRSLLATHATLWIDGVRGRHLLRIWSGRILAFALYERLDSQPWNPFAWLLRPYAALCLARTTECLRALVFEADRTAAQAAGGQVLRSGLREVAAFDWAWQAFLEQHLNPAVMVGARPYDVLGGFTRYCESRADDLAAVRAGTVSDTAPPYNPFPTWAQRVAALEGLDGDHGLGDEAPAAGLLPDFAAVAARTDALWDAPALERVAWEALPERLLRARHKDRAAGAYAVMERLFGRGRAGLETLVREVEAGHRDHLFQTLDQRAFPKGGLDSILVIAALDGRSVRAVQPWGGAPTLLRPDGRELDLAAIKAPLFAVEPDPRRFRELLAEAGIDLARAVPGGAGIAPSN